MANKPVDPIDSLRNAILMGISKESIKAGVTLEEWEDLSVLYNKDNKMFYISVRMKRTGGQVLEEIMRKGDKK